MLEYHPQTYYVLLMTVNVSLTLVVMLAACLCCKKKVPKNELLGLEGMVKLKNPDEVVVVTAVGNSESQADLNLSTISNADSEKRASTAAHRSLPDIPVAENNGDNGSELYETVADKRMTTSHQNQDKSPVPSLKQQASVSQHSSISQADDVSSPYSRVKNSPHDYAKVRTTEHPYAQLNAPSTLLTAASSSNQMALNNDSANHDSQNQVNQRQSNQNLSENALQAEIPAASAIAGIIAASQDLPYMTPPIANQHFSGDSQDSSKGYTSISVREPLANILAQQPSKPIVHRNPPITRDVNDSHYATVSDDSDETYAAIEDPNSRQAATTAADIYTSGSETYAQIQPMQSNSIVVSVEINNSSTNSGTLASSNAVTFEHVSTAAAQQHSQNAHHATNNQKSSAELTPVPPPVDSLRAQMHSRQASSSSNNSSMGNLGSPKPEKRQANSPLPPTPKSNASSSSHQQYLGSSSSNLTSGRNSVISVIECGGAALDLSGGSSTIAVSAVGAPDDSPQRKSLSPSKDIEGMYAKVMKKNKFSRNASSSQNNSPIMTRKYNEHDDSLGVSPLDSVAAELTDTSHNASSVSGAASLDKIRTRSNSYSVKDHGYETIPADAMRLSTTASGENRKSDCYTNILQKERQLEEASKLSSSLTYKDVKPPIFDTELVYRGEKDYETIAAPSQKTRTNDPGYETLLKTTASHPDPDNEKKSSDYDPNYEVLKTPKYSSNITSAAALSDDGYAKVLEKNRIAIDEDSTDGYSKVKGDVEDGTTGGYSTIGEVKTGIASDANHNYASILETKAAISSNNPNETDSSDHYARIAETSRKPPVPDLQLNALAAVTQVVVVGEEGNDAKTPRLQELPVTPSSLTSSSIIANSSTISSSNMTSTTSTLSSHQTPTSQYESFTGSDSDPNYESVCYLNSSRENPYERLHTDYSDTQLSSPLSPDESGTRATNVVVAPVPPPATLSSTPILTANGSKPPTSGSDLSETAVVDDYFQV